MAKTTATYDDGDAASSVLAYTDADGAKAPAGVCCYLSGTTAVPIDVTNRLPVTLGLTDAELRATAVPVSLTSTTVTGTVAVTQSTSPWVVSLASTTITGSVAVTGPLTDAQLRASAVPVSLTSTTITGTVGVTVADGSDEALGAKADAAASTDTGTFSLIALFKRLLSKFTTQLPSVLTSDALKVGGAAAHDAAVSGNPVLMGGYASGGTPTEVGEGDAARVWLTRSGAVRVSSGDPGEPVYVRTGSSAFVASGTDPDDEGSYQFAGTYYSGSVGVLIAWSNLRDSSGNEIASATATPGASDRGLVVRQPEPQTLTAGQVSVTASATQIVAARSGRRAVVVTQHGTTAVYLGPTGVTTSTGLLLTGTAGAIQVLPGGAAVFGVTVSGSQTVSFAEVY